MSMQRVGRSSAVATTIAAVCVAAVGAVGLVAPGVAGARPSASTPGVTAHRIDIGVSSIDLSKVTQYTHGLTQGDFKGVFTALIDNVNKHGGIDGRKVVPTFVSPNPLETASAASACTKLTEDRDVFAVLGEFYMTDVMCYVQTHATPVVGGTQTNTDLAAARAPWFTTSPNTDVLEPATVEAAAKAGVFKKKTVGMVVPAAEPHAVLAKVETALARAGAKPKVSVTLAATTDSEALFQQVSGVVAPKFQAAGVNVVVAVGTSATTWVDATGAGSYHPRLVGTDYAYMTSAISGNAKANPAVVKGAVSANPKPLAENGKAIGWADPKIQKCASQARAAGVKFANPVTDKSTTDKSYMAVSFSCQTMALFEAIVAKAGKNLTRDSFRRAANTLGRVDIPGLGTAVYDKAHPAGSFPLYLYTWNVHKNAWVVSAKPVGTS